MAASLKDKRKPITTQVPSVDITPDPPIFSLVTTFKGIVAQDEIRSFRDISRDTFKHF
jgi:hypothetical protein